jgi:PAS domain S-box-containing protein
MAVLQQHQKRRRFARRRAERLSRQPKGRQPLPAVPIDKTPPPVPDLENQQRQTSANDWQYRSLFEASPDAILVTIADGRILSANPAAQAMFGMTEEEFCRAGRQQLIDPQDPRIGPLLEERARSGRVRGTLTYVRKDGSTFEGEFVSVILDEHGRAFVIIRDISKRTRAEELLRVSEEKFRAVFEQAAVGIGRVSFADARWIDVNAAFCRMLGYTPEELRAMPWPDITHPEDVESDLVPFRRMAAGELDHYTVEKRFIHKDGHPVWARLTLSLVRNRAGEPDYEIAVIEDLTERKKAEAEWQQLLTAVDRNRAELDTILNAIADAVIVYGLEGEVVHLNPAVRRMFGYSLEMLSRPLPERLAWLRAETADGSPFPFERMPVVRALKGEVVVGEIMVLHPPDRPPLWTAVSTAPVHGSAGEIFGAVGTYTDITRLQELQRERELFVHTISHDLRSPLTVVLGHAQMLATSCRGEKERVHLDALLQGAERMNEMIAELVEAARLEGGPIELQREPIELQGYLDDLLTRLAASLDTARIRTRIPADLPPVHADRARLERIMVNLLSNALNYSPPEQPVEVAFAADGETVLCSVEDRGQGIEPRDLPHIFERFYRPKTRRRVGGVGLGLYITKALVEAHDGRIWAKSEVGQGSTFYVRLPFKGEEIGEKEDE